MRNPCSFTLARLIAAAVPLWIAAGIAAGVVLDQWGVGLVLALYGLAWIPLAWRSAYNTRLARDAGDPDLRVTRHPHEADPTAEAQAEEGEAPRKRR